MTWEGWLAVAALLLAAIALVCTVNARRSVIPARIPATGQTPVGLEQLAPDTGHTQFAFIANPSKNGVAGLREELLRVCADRELPEPFWLETTPEDPGIGQARTAVARGATTVVALGGDGTVRAVAEALVGTQVPMGLIPVGTGNLLARNLDIPIGDPMAAFLLVLDGVNRTIDVGWLRVLRQDPHRGEQAGENPSDSPADAALSPDERRPHRSHDHIFLVIAGVGFDAAMVADADDGLKAKVGWMAYFVAGIKHLHGRRLRTTVQLNSGSETTVRVRSLLIGNCGRLPGGITLLPDAVVDDGWLDVAAIDTRAGIAGWAQLLGEVVLQGVGYTTQLPAKIGRIDHARARTVQVTVAGGEFVQVDGDLIGRVHELSARVQEAALVVRVAAS